ncbi:MAG: ArsR/SmtB family transcription factor [Vicinamibacterales bacterium]
MDTTAALDYIDDPDRARVALHPVRRRILEALGDGASAPALARSLGLPRQQVNYHLGRLAAERLVQSEETGRVGRRIDRTYRRTARSYVIVPRALAGLGLEPAQVEDKVSSAYLAAVSAKTLADLAALGAAADRAGKRVPTLTLTADVRVGTPQEMAALAAALTDAFTTIVARFHDDRSPAGRTFRLVLGGYPAVRDRSPVTDPTAARTEGASPDD